MKKITQVRSAIGQTDKHRGTLRALGLGKIGRVLAGARDARRATVGIAVYSRLDYMPRGYAPFESMGAEDFLVLFDKDTMDDAAFFRLRK